MKRLVLAAFVARPGRARAGFGRPVRDRDPEGRRRARRRPRGPGCDRRAGDEDRSVCPLRARAVTRASCSRSTARPGSSACGRHGGSRSRPNDPLISRQWYLGRIHAFDAWAQLPTLASVRVAVLDSGIDSGHPDLQGQIVDGRSFVSSSWETDTNGHGTFVAGEIAAATNNGTGIAAVGFPVELLIAKIVRADGTISPDAEARAIHWAVDRGARVINMSFGGVRDPHDRGLDTYSPLEAAAVQYAVSKGVLVVAAVGNADSAPSEPWNYAGYPAALPHVLGVSSLNRDGTVPNFSNRDCRYVDIAAPGEVDLLDAPARADRCRPGPAVCLQGYSDCGPMEFRRGEGTSFSAPQVSAAARAALRDRPGPPGGSGLDHPHENRSRLGPRHGLPPLLHRPRPAHRLGPARRRQRRPRARRSAARRPTATRRTTGCPLRRRSGAARASGSRRRSTTGTTATTSTRSRSTAGRRSSRSCAGPRARTRISSCGSPARRASAALRSTSGSWPHSLGRPDRWTRSGSALRRAVGTTWS